MGDRQSTEFVHKLKLDWTVHSYCSRCYATVGDSLSLDELDVAEKEHKCDPRILEMVQKFREVSRPVSAA